MLLLLLTAHILGDSREESRVTESIVVAYLGVLRQEDCRVTE